MTVDYSKLQMSTLASSNKVLLQGSGTIAVPNLPGTGQQAVIATIPHGYLNDQLLFQVSATISLTGTNWTTLPYMSNDGRLIMWAYVDSTTLNIVINHNDSSGAGFPSSTVNYQYRVLIP